MPVPLKAKRDFPYAGRRVTKDQDFEARSSSDARLLKAIGHAEDRPAAPPRAAPQTYRTRMMTAETPGPVVTSHPYVPPIAATAPAPAAVAAELELDTMEADALHELAKSRGVYVHHRAGADRVRQALREAQQDSAAE